jgi:hypothetical protein
VDSSKRRVSDTAYCYVVSFDDDSAACKEDECFRLVLKGLSCQLTWGNITGANGTFTVTAAGVPHAIALPPGNYSFKQLAAAITSAFFAGAQVDYEVFRCRYDAVACKLVFSGAGPLALTFPSLATAGVYGFAALAPGALTSTRPLNPMPKSSLVVSVAGVRPRATYNLANTVNETVHRTNMLAHVPIDSYLPPFSIVQWSNPDDRFAMYLTERNLDVLQVQITDPSGDPFTSMPDHHLTFQLDTYRAIDLQHQSLRSIDDSMRTLVLQRALL